ncbi:MAG: type II toxin-antitoxin system HicA family toxin [Caulobacter sp.]|nr:type II toxin-antitoxin system HicA family toxin [Caulobacter sp.]
MPSSRTVLQKLIAAGWEVDSQKGSHVHLKHPDQPGKITVNHPVRDMTIGTIKSLERQSGLKLRE